MKGLRYQENIRRVPVRGIGTIFASEQAVVEWDGTLSCDFMSIDFKTDGVRDAIRRVFPNIFSQALTGNVSFEDQLLLDTEGIQLDVYKKVKDLVNPDGTIKPKIKPFAIISRALIESDGFDISEGSISGKSQSFKVLDPVTYLS